MFEDEGESEGDEKDEGEGEGEAEAKQSEEDDDIRVERPSARSETNQMYAQINHGQTHARA